MSSLQPQVADGKREKFSVRDSISNTRANLLKVVMNNRQTKARKQAKLLVIGLSGAGKSTLLEFIKRGAVVEKTRQPTIAFHRYRIDFGKLEMIFIDAPGQQTYWSQWKNYFKEADGIIFLFDSANFMKVQVMNQLIYDMLKLHKLQTPTLFLANKQDLDNSISTESIDNLLHLRHRLSNSAIYPISAINGDGVLNAFKWMLVNILSLEPVS